MKAQLTVNGRTIEVELSTEQLQQLGVEEKRVKKWEDLENIEGWYVSNKPCTDHIEDSDTRIYAVYVIALSLIMLLISNLL